jgi:glucokinase
MIDNDANSAALGEYWKGAGDKAKDVVFVTLGTGVGGGVVANGHLVHGINNGAGEIGHITVQPGGYLCTCGKRGCLEQYASATGVVRLAKDLAKEFTGKSRIQELLDSDEGLTSKMVFYLADNGDILANRIVDRVCSYLGLALSDIGNILNPENIIIGGGVSNAGNTLLQPTTRYFQENAFPSVRDSTKLKLAQLGNDAGVIGAASLALQFRNR